MAVAREGLVPQSRRRYSGAQRGQRLAPAGPVRPAHLQAPVPGELAAARRASRPSRAPGTLRAQGLPAMTCALVMQVLH